MTTTTTITRKKESFTTDEKGREKDKTKGIIESSSRDGKQSKPLLLPSS
jgi:hypothetical protein